MIDLDKSLFNIKIGNPKPSEGSLLVAEPFMGDNYFNHAVILLLDYGTTKRPMGLVMNRVTPYTLGDSIEGFADGVDIPLYCGGPVSAERLFYIHRMGNMFSGSIPIGENIWIGGNYNQVCEYVAEGLPTKGLIRFFIGYSGWDEGQLEQEISQHVWAVAPQLPPRLMLTGNEDAYWHKVVRSMGPAYSQWLLHPMYPSAN